MRGLFGDVIADQVMGYILCFARNLHTYIRNQVEHRYEPVGGESSRVDNASGPGTVNAMDRGTIYLPEATLGVVGLGAIGAEIARRGLAFGMTVRAVDRFPERTQPPDGVEAVEGMERLDALLSWSDFAVIAAPHTPETAGLFDAATLAHLRPSSYLINIGRGAIVVLDDLVAALRAGRSPARRSTCSRSSRCRPTIRSGTSPTSSSPRTRPATRPRSPRATWPPWRRTCAGSTGASPWPIGWRKPCGSSAVCSPPS